MKTQNTTYSVTYTKRVGGEGTILVRAQNEKLAINTARFLCATGSDFRNATPTTEPYVKPRKQGFYGRH